MCCRLLWQEQTCKCSESHALHTWSFTAGTGLQACTFSIPSFAQVLMAGGEYYESAYLTWVQTTDLFSLDFSLPPSLLMWRVVTAAESDVRVTLNSTSQNSVVAGLGVVEDNSQIAQMTATVRKKLRS